jgi:hypothetical protein
MNGKTFVDTSVLIYAHDGCRGNVVSELSKLAEWLTLC